MGGVAVYSETYSKRGGCPRFVIIESTTGEIIDDANGYGYKSERKAYNAFRYKLKHGEYKHGVVHV